ncbi:MAG: protein-L-isoaspartate(D-aspartate) O-methyltransferase [Hyphomicrobiales bacterium]|nr:protein-L-isoaspartate(D-aspartate) O-methyltransferase [Hyphomicrobiales bacterium]
MSRLAEAREKLFAKLRREGAAGERVLRAMESVPREAFAPPDLGDEAYADEALRIGCGQTISQPFIVAYMTEALDLGDAARVLEIGAGSGYQTAVLARLAAKVYSVETHRPLAMEALARIEALGFNNVEIAHGDGAAGWAEHAPFDRVIVTAAAREPPRALIEQLGEGGVIVLPLGGDRKSQHLFRGRKRAGRMRWRRLMPVRFVPFT